MRKKKCNPTLLLSKIEELQVDVAALKTDVKWIKKLIWFIISMLLAIFAKLFI